MHKIFPLLLPLLLTAAGGHAATPADSTSAWNKFAAGDADNVLLDFSAAGYDHGASLPPDWTLDDYKANGYTVYNICDYGAVANDEVSDRDAYLAIVAKINKKAKAKAVIYFPAGRYILHTAADDVNGVSSTITLSSGYVVLKGDGRDKTTIAMGALMVPKDSTKMWSSDPMLTIKNQAGIKDTLANVTASADINTWKVTIDNASKLSAGMWVCLYMRNKSASIIRKEMGNHTIYNYMTNILAGVEVIDFHQIDHIDGNDVYFKEPIMKAVGASEGWVLRKWNHYEHVGIEDLTFEGQASPHFKHHGSWRDDGGYKPIVLTRLTDSWVRRVNFVSCSECITFEECANCSAYDIDISGNRGHAAIRMANSSRGFIGCVNDHADGYYTSDTSYKTHKKGLGQYHAVGVSKHSIGNVIWRCKWGTDGCFESHATQPRASLFDVSEGAFIAYRMGGDLAQLPNHLDNLTIWNHNTTRVDSVPFRWWYESVAWIKVMPPTIVGLHGVDVNWYDENEMKLNENQGVTVSPYSLYEAQLTRRLGSLPQWVTDLKGIDPTTGIQAVTAPSANRRPQSGCYNLAGQYLGNDLAALSRGIYIVNGKKVVKSK